MITVGAAIVMLLDYARDLRWGVAFEPDWDDVPSWPTRRLRPAPYQSPPSLPVLGVLSSPFGPRGGRPHHGIDIAVKVGTPVTAYAGGVCIFAGWRGAYGKAVILDHGEGRHTLYGHLDSIRVSVGEEVSHGDHIAASGNTGRSTGPHLHFEMRVRGQRVDPQIGWIQ